MKVHVICTDFAKTSWNEVLQKRDDLGRAINDLSASMGETAYFHDYVEPMCGAPVLMVECSDKLMEEIKKLPGFDEEHDLSPNVSTFRSPALQNHFARPAPAKKRPPVLKPPKP